MATMVPSLKHPETKTQRRSMLVFRGICAVIVAWAINWVLSQPLAANLLEKVPEMTYVAPVAGALVGFVALSKRQGWGIIVALANGVWTLLLVVGVAWLLHLTLKLGSHVMHGLVADFENFLRILAYETEPLAEGWIDPRLVGVLLLATIVASLFTEGLHWVLVRLRRLRGEDEEEEEEDGESAQSRRERHEPA